MRNTPLLILLPTLGALGCADSYSLAGEDKGAYADTGWGGGAAAGDEGYDGDASDTGYDDGYGSEDESAFLKLSPAATDAYVFVANPDRNTVTRIAVGSLAVDTTTVGSDPTIALTSPDYRRAVTFNAGSDDVSVIDADTLEVSTVEVRENYNQMVMSPDGAWVVCYHDSRVEDDGSGSSSSTGTVSYNEFSLVNIETLEHVPMVGGKNPHGVKFTADGSTALVVADDYLSVVDLTAEPPTIERVPLTDDLLDPPEAEEVVVDPDGNYAIVRQYAATVLRAVDLHDFEVSDLDVGDNPTDLDVTPDGRHAVAVARGSGELWVYDLDDLAAEPQVIEMPTGEVFGSIVLSPDDTKGLLYSTQTGQSRYASWDRATDEITVRSLVKPVDTVAVSPTGGTALVFHPKDDGEDVDPDSPFAGSYALTLIDLADFFSNPLKLPAEPIAFDSTEDGENGIFIMDGEPYLVELDYSSLLYEEVELKSEPVYIGVLPDTRVAYASQDHPLGRISFYDIDTQELQTITGFELNSGIDQ